MSPRYALYLTPPEGSALERAASAWLGRSAFGGPGCAPSLSRGASRAPAAPPAAAVGTPARYGFHATMRAPFRLAEGVSETDLIRTFEATYDGAPPLEVALTVSALRSFVALIAGESAREALSLAEALALDTMEPLRAPLTEAERARRNPESLDARGRDLLDAYGYPHVRERFLFHMTLSGPVEGSVAPVVAAAQTHFAALLNRPLPLVHALLREPEGGGAFSVLVVQQPAGRNTELVPS